MLNSRSRRLKVVRSTASAMKTPTWKAIQNQILVDTAQTVPFSSATRNAKAPQSIHAHALDVAIYDRRNLRRSEVMDRRYRRFPLANRSLLRSLFDSDGCRTGETCRSRKADCAPGRSARTIAARKLLPAQKLG